MIQAGINVGFSELLIIFDSISTHKISYDRDNRVISPYRPYRRGGLLPQFGAIISWVLMCEQAVCWDILIIGQSAGKSNLYLYCIIIYISIIMTPQRLNAWFYLNE